MDREPEELQFLSLFGIYREAFKITHSCRKIFTQITLALILPLSFIFLSHIYISEFLFRKIVRNEYVLDNVQYSYDRSAYNRISSRLSSEWTAFWLFKVVYLVFVLILSLLSTAAVVYTIACIYTAKEITFRKVLSVVPKVWKRLMITFLWNSAIIFGYNVVAILVIVVWVFVFIGGTTAPGIVLLVIIVIVYLTGFVYISVIWHLASVISVLEDVYGIQAMIKSKSLIKGKMGVASIIFIMLQSSLVGIQIGFEHLFVHGWFLGTGVRVSFGVLFLMLLLMLSLLGLIVQTVVYFVCKSYHHENIDKSCLADHLEVYLGEYVPLTGKDVQLEQYHV